MTSLLDLYKILNTIYFCSFLLDGKDKEIHNLSDCELENELRDFDDLPMNDLDGSNDMDGNLVYGEGLPLEDYIHQINDDLGF
jgi:hypothetical protein